MAQVPLKQQQRIVQPAEMQEFRSRTLADNILRLAGIAAVGSFVNLVIVIVELLLSKRFGIESWLRLSWITASALYVLLAVGPGRRPVVLQRVVFVGAAALSLLFSAVITGLIPAQQGSTFLFIINILLTGLFLCLSLPQLAVVTGPALLYLVFAMLYFEGRAISQLSNSLNIFAVSSFSLLVSWFSYRARLERFGLELSLRANNEFLKTLVDVDGLTGVANRRKVDETLASMNALASREGLPLSILIVDLDDFKAYNDTYGHLEGDRLLRTVAHSMKACLSRESDFFGRYGGEEFIAILPGTEISGAVLMAEKMRSAVEGLKQEHEKTLHGISTISCGVACAIPVGLQGAMDILNRADTALYEAKMAGKNRVFSA